MISICAEIACTYHNIYAIVLDRMARTAKRILAVGDLHCGHAIGLTPPSRHDKPSEFASDAAIQLADMRKRLWDVYAKYVRKNGPYDVALVNADCIDGRGERSGGTELITTDVLQQCDMAAECIKYTRAPIVHITAGTPYHVGKLTDFERIVAKEVQDSKFVTECQFHDQLNLKVNGSMINMRHHVNASSVPHGAATPVLKAMLWNELWASREGHPLADLVIRSHTHRPVNVGDPDREGVVLPALQALGSKFGARRCEAVVRFGFCIIEVDSRGAIRWQWIVPKEVSAIQAAKITHLR